MVVKMTDNQYIDENYDFYIKTNLNEYSGKYVAIHEKNVQFSSENIEEVYNWMQEHFPEVIPFIVEICPAQVMLL